MFSLNPGNHPATSQRNELLRVLNEQIESLCATPPVRPQHWESLLSRTAHGFDRAPLDANLAAATRALRDAIFTIPRREKSIELLWPESLACALYASRIARLRGASIATTNMAGLLHRVGDALFQRSVAAAELAAATTLDVMSRARIAAGAQRRLALALLQTWQLPEAVVAAALDWRDGPDANGRGGAATAVYWGHLLASEAVGAKISTPGLDDALTQQVGLENSEVEELRFGGVTPRELLLALG